MKHAAKRVLCALLLMLLISGNAIRTVSAEEAAVAGEQLAGEETPPAEDPSVGEPAAEELPTDNGTLPADPAEDRTVPSGEALGEGTVPPEDIPEEVAVPPEEVPAEEMLPQPGVPEEAVPEEVAVQDEMPEETAPREAADPPEEETVPADETAPGEEIPEESEPEGGMLREQPALLGTRSAAPIRAVDYPGVTAVPKGSIMDSAFASGIKWTTKSAVSFWAEEGYSYSIGNKVLRAAEYENAPPSIGKVVTWAILPESENASGHIGAWITNAGVYKGEPVDIRETFYWEPVIFGSEKFQPMIMVGFNYSSRNLNNGFRDFNGYTVRYEVYRHSDHSSPLAIDTAVLMGDLDDYQQIQLKRSDCISRIQVTEDSRIYMTEVGDRYVGYAGNTSSIDYPEDSFRVEMKGVKEFYLTFGMGCSQNIGFVNQLDPQCSAEDRLRFIAGECRQIRDQFRTADNGSDWYGLYGLGYWNTRSFGGYTMPVPVKRASDGDEQDAVRHTVKENETFSYQISVTIPDEYPDYYYDAFALTDELPAGIVYLSSAIIDDGDNDVTSKFDITASGQRITAALKNTKDTEFYNNSYRWRINVRTEAGIRNGTLVNTARVEARRGNEAANNPSNPVETLIIRSKRHITTSAEGGTIDPSVDADDGTDVVIGFRPDEGRHLTTVTVDGKPVPVKGDETSYTFRQIDADHSIHVVFAVNTYRVTTSAVGGSVDPSMEGIPFGESRTIRYAPDEGRFLTQVKVNGKETALTPGQSQTALNDIRADQTLHVVFSKLPEKRVTDGQGKDINGKVVAKGKKVNYTVTLFNDADKDILCDVEDRLQEGLEFVEADQGGVPDSGRTIRWKDVRVPANGTASVSFCCTAAGDGKIVNEAAAEYEGVPGKVGTGQTVIFVPDAPVKRSASGGQVLLPGDRIVYTITASNPCDEKKEITIRDRLPESAEFVSADQNGVLEDGTVVWHVQADPHTSVSVELTVKAAPDSAGRVLKNSAEVTLDGEKMQTGEIVNAIQEKPVKSVMNEDGISIDGRSVSKGSCLYYTIAFRNPSSEAKQYTVTDAVPENSTFASASEGGSYDRAKGTVTWTVQAAPGETREVSFCVHAGEAGSMISNTAQIRVDSITLDTNRTVNVVPPDPVKTVEAPDGSDLNGKTVFAGALLTYRIRVANPFDTPREFTVTDRLPDGTVFEECSDGGIYSEGSVRWQVTVPGSGEKTLMLRVKAGACGAAGAVLVNRAEASMESWRALTGEVKNYVTPVPVKEVRFRDGRDACGQNVQNGDVLVYRITVSNPRDAAKAVFVVRDYFQSERLAFISADNGGRLMHDETGDKVRWEFMLEPGSSRTVSFEAKVIRNDHTIGNVAEADVNGSTAVSNSVASHPAAPPLKAVFFNGAAADGTVIPAGEEIEYRITVNNPCDAARDFVLEDRAGQYLSFAGENTADAGLYRAAFRLEPYEERVFRIRALTDRDTPAGTLISNTAFLRCGDIGLASNEVWFTVSGRQQSVPASAAGVRTGDGRRPLLWAGLLGAGLAALGLWNRRNRKKAGRP